MPATSLAVFYLDQKSCVTVRRRQLIKNFRWRRWGSSLPVLPKLDPLLSPPSTPAEIFRRTCLGGGVKNSKSERKPLGPIYSQSTQKAFMVPSENQIPWENV